MSHNPIWRPGPAPNSDESESIDNEGCRVIKYRGWAPCVHSEDEKKALAESGFYSNTGSVEMDPDSQLNLEWALWELVVFEGANLDLAGDQWVGVSTDIVLTHEDQKPTAKAHLWIEGDTFKQAVIESLHQVRRIKKQYGEFPQEVA